MGTIRTLLALSVVLYHSYHIFGEKLVGGRVAVQAFYLISGFYMALILNEKYKAGKGSYKLFLTNRFLRIFPAYWVTLFLVILMCVAGQIGWNQPFYFWYWANKWDTMHWSTIVLFILANVFLIGSDWLTYSGVNERTGLLELSRSSFSYSPMAFQFLLIPQIWSVGVEVSFYLIAPFLLRKKWVVQAGVLLASLLLRYILFEYQGMKFDPWTYRFFPNELAFFMAGSLAYKLYVVLKHKKIPNYVNGTAWLLAIALIVIYPHIDFMEEKFLHWYFYSLFVLLLPFIFLFSKNNKYDRIAGELSFPIYIGHHFIMFLWRQYFFTHFENLKWFGAVTAISTLLFAIILWLGVINPIEKIRQRRLGLIASMT